MSLNYQKHFWLEKKYLQKLNHLVKSRDIKRGDILEEAIIEFKKMISKKKDYQIRFSEFDKIKTFHYSIYLIKKQNQKVCQLAIKLRVPKSILIREVIISFLMQKKDEDFNN